MIRIFYLDFPADVYGAVQKSPQGNYIIGINSNLPPEERKKALIHEIAHIRLDHFNSEKSLIEIEAEADKVANAFF